MVPCWGTASAPGSLLLPSPELIAAQEKEKKWKNTTEMCFYNHIGYKKELIGAQEKEKKGRVLKNVGFALTNIFFRCDCASSKKASMKTQFKPGRVQALVS